MKPYRKNASVVIFNSDKKVLLCQRIKEDGDFSWQFPQGGIDEGEDVVKAATREVIEETSITSIKLVHSIKDPFFYDFPINLSHFNFKGQEQYWSLFYFYGNDNEINLNTKEPEFKDYKWVDIKEAPHSVIYFKKDTYQKATAILEPIINEYKD